MNRLLFLSSYLASYSPIWISHGPRLCDRTTWRLRCSSIHLCPLLLLSAVAPFASLANAEIIYESGSLGPTGMERTEIDGGSNVGSDVFVGVRFYLDQPVITSHVGGHFVKNIGANESFFGAIVALDDEDDFPDSGNLSTPDVMGTTLLAFPDPSNEVFGSLTKPLAPGWYSLVFGSGLFSAVGGGVAVNNGMDIGSPAYIAWQPGAVNGWGDLINPIFRNFRFVVNGNAIPEPRALALIGVGIFGVLGAYFAFGLVRRTAVCLLFVAMVSVGPFAAPANAEIIYESGSLGPTGIPWSDLTDDIVEGININQSLFVGVRFRLNQPVITTEVGGHFTAPSNSTFFGAIVRLENESDFPNTSDLSSPDVIGQTLLTFPVPSAEVFGNLSLSLDPGWYALVFGSGLFGATGFGGALENNTDFGNAAYIAFGPNLNWHNLDTLPVAFENHRFVVKGQIIPEPRVMAFVGLSLIGVIGAHFEFGRIRRLICCLLLVVMASVGPFVDFANAETIYESGALGPTGIPQGAVNGANVNAFVFNGVRFNLTSPVVTTHVGGHIVGPVGTTGTLFGAIVKLVDEKDFPDSGDLSTPDVLGSTILTFPEPSAEVFGNLSLALEPGWYSLVFGSGLFGATGDGAMPLNNRDIGNPTYIGFQPGGVAGWGNLLNPIFRNYRFLVRGEVVPETNVVALIGMALIGLIGAHLEFRHIRRMTLCLLLIAMASVGSFVGSANAEIIFESGSLGPTEVSWTDLTSGVVPGTSINQSFFAGVRFQLNQPVRSTEVGGHFTAPSNSTFFGAIVRLENEHDFPDTVNLSSPDVIGHTLLRFPVPSADVFGNLSLSLSPGWYALVFGGGLFDANGFGGALRNNTDLGDPSYIAFDPNFDWFNLEILPIAFVNHRFVVKGEIVPEPGLGLVLLAFLTLLFARTARRR